MISALFISLEPIGDDAVSCISRIMASAFSSSLPASGGVEVPVHDRLGEEALTADADGYASSRSSSTIVGHSAEKWLLARSETNRSPVRVGDGFVVDLAHLPDLVRAGEAEHQRTDAELGREPTVSFFVHAMNSGG